MTGQVRALALSCLVALSASAAGCADKVTQVVVSIDAESSWRNDTTSVRVVVRGGAAGDAGLENPSRDVTLMVGAGESYTFPIDVTVAPLNGDVSRRWAVDATAVNTVSNATATVRVRGSYVSGRTLRVDLVFENTCAGIMCDSDETCRAGACVDAGVITGPVDAGVDAGPSDGGADGDVSDAGDTGVPLHCPDPDIRVANPLDGTLDNSGIPPSYPTLEECPTNHDPGDECTDTASNIDICYSARSQGGVAYCRTPCTLGVGDGGVATDDPICATTVHPDSRCVPGLGLGSEPDVHLCSIPCNPFDDVGCPSGLSCVPIGDSEIEAVFTDCLELEADPRHHLEPCSIENGDTYPTPIGCAPGYICGYDWTCGDQSGAQGYVCQQICDPDDTSPRVTCPTGTECFQVGNGAFDDAIGPINIGRCGT
jgi:hypothetical protein